MCSYRKASEFPYACISRDRGERNDFNRVVVSAHFQLGLAGLSIPYSRSLQTLPSARLMMIKARTWSLEQLASSRPSSDGWT